MSSLIHAMMFSSLLSSAPEVSYWASLAVVEDRSDVTVKVQGQASPALEVLDRVSFVRHAGAGSMVEGAWRETAVPDDGKPRISGLRRVYLDGHSVVDYSLSARGFQFGRSLVLQKDTKAYCPLDLVQYENLWKRESFHTSAPIDYWNHPEFAARRAEIHQASTELSFSAGPHSTVTAYFGDDAVTLETGAGVRLAAPTRVEIVTDVPGDDVVRGFRHRTVLHYPRWEVLGDQIFPVTITREQYLDQLLLRTTSVQVEDLALISPEDLQLPEYALFLPEPPRVREADFRSGRSPSAVEREGLTQAEILERYRNR